MREERKVYRVLVVTPEEKTQSEVQSADGRM
jgi:hypothetical protein